MPSESSAVPAPRVAIAGRSSTRSRPHEPRPALLPPEEDVVGDRQLGREREVLVDDLDAACRATRAASGSRACSPSTRSEPYVGCTAPQRIFRSVDLPAPLSPTRPTTSPRLTLEVDVLRARRGCRSSARSRAPRARRRVRSRPRSALIALPVRASWSVSTARIRSTSLDDVLACRPIATGARTRSGARRGCRPRSASRRSVPRPPARLAPPRMTAVTTDEEVRVADLRRRRRELRGDDDAGEAGAERRSR